MRPARCQDIAGQLREGRRESVQEQDLEDEEDRGEDRPERGDVGDAAPQRR